MARATTYAVHTEACTYLLDDDGLCCRILSPGGLVTPGMSAAIGSQFVACLDLTIPGGLVAELRVGSAALFATKDEKGRYVLLRTSPIQHIEARQSTQPLLPPPVVPAAGACGPGASPRPTVQAFQIISQVGPGRPRSERRASPSASFPGGAPGGGGHRPLAIVGGDPLPRQTPLPPSATSTAGSPPGPASPATAHHRSPCRCHAALALRDAAFPQGTLHAASAAPPPPPRAPARPSPGAACPSLRAARDPVGPTPGAPHGPQPQRQEMTPAHHSRVRVVWVRAILAVSRRLQPTTRPER
jgi:hypothetical protein